MGIMNKSWNENISEFPKNAKSDPTKGLENGAKLGWNSIFLQEKFLKDSLLIPFYQSSLVQILLQSNSENKEVDIDCGMLNILIFI